MNQDATQQTELEQPKQNEAVKPTGDKPAVQAGKPQRGGRDNRRRGKGAGGRGGRGDRRSPRADVPAESDYEEKNIEVSRVTRVTKGGKRMRFRVLAVIGNHKGRVGFGVAKGLDVAAAMSKATSKARKALITVPVVNETIPHMVRVKHGAAQLIIKPAPKGTGVKAGGPVRTTLELAGVPNITAKILGTTNKISNVKAIFEALQKLSAPPQKAATETPADEIVAEQKKVKA